MSKGVSALSECRLRKEESIRRMCRAPEMSKIVRESVFPDCTGTAGGRGSSVVSGVSGVVAICPVGLVSPGALLESAMSTAVDELSEAERPSGRVSVGADIIVAMA